MLPIKPSCDKLQLESFVGVINLIHTDLLFESNKHMGAVRAPIKGKKIVYESSSTFFSSKTLKSILRFINSINERGYPSGMPVFFCFKKQVHFSDKLTYILFESICYQLIQSGHPVYVSLEPEYDIITHGFTSSPLWLLSTLKKGSQENFCDKFHHDFFKLHFRQVLQNDAKEEELSIMMDDIASFQKFFNIKEEDREKITEVLVELVGNAKEHSSGDCLIDFDISETYLKRNEDTKQYRGINIAILNFSPELLGTSIQQKLCNGYNLPERYDQVRQALEYHRPFFSDHYMEEDFYNIATFQHRISGRNQNITGGTGLTKLIQSLEESSDAYSCYVLSGQRRLEFQKDYMMYKDGLWIGFNEQNNFLKDPPNSDLLQSNPIFLPGTAYNLNFVMEVI